MAKGQTARIGKEDLGGLAISFAQPGPQGRNRIFAQWRATRFASFADTSNVGTAAQDHVLAAKSHQLGSAQPRLCGK